MDERLDNVGYGPIRFIMYFFGNHYEDNADIFGILKCLY